MRRTESGALSHIPSAFDVIRTTPTVREFLRRITIKAQFYRTHSFLFAQLSSVPTLSDDIRSLHTVSDDRRDVSYVIRGSRPYSERLRRSAAFLPVLRRISAASDLIRRYPNGYAYLRAFTKFSDGFRPRSASGRRAFCLRLYVWAAERTVLRKSRVSP